MAESNIFLSVLLFRIKTLTEDKIPRRDAVVVKCKLYIGHSLFMTGGGGVDDRSY